MSEKRQVETLKVISDMIKACEQTLLQVTQTPYEVPALLTLVKLLLVQRNENFGCGYQGKQRVNDCYKISNQLK
jgi:hypothetical protein